MTEYHLRTAQVADLAEIMTIIKSAIQYLKAQGSPQWQNGQGPTTENMKKMILEQVGYVLVNEEGEIAAVAALVAGVDPVYTAIDGQWLQATDDYFSIHRVAVSPAFCGQGIANIFLHQLIEEGQRLGKSDIRIDTFPKNQPMIHTILKAGFIKTGMVHFPIPDGQRVAFQFITEKI